MGTAESKAAGFAPGELYTKDGFIYRTSDNSILDISTLKLPYDSPAASPITSTGKRVSILSRSRIPPRLTPIKIASRSSTIPISEVSEAASSYDRDATDFLSISLPQESYYVPGSPSYPPPMPKQRPVSVINTRVDALVYADTHGMPPGPRTSTSTSVAKSLVTPTHLIPQSPAFSPSPSNQLDPMFSPDNFTERPLTRDSSIGGSPGGVEDADHMFAGVLGDMTEEEDTKKRRRTSMFRSLSTRDSFGPTRRPKSTFIGGSRKEGVAGVRQPMTFYENGNAADFYSSKAGNDAALASSWLSSRNRASCTFDMMSYDAQRLMLSELSPEADFEQAISDSSFPTDPANDSSYVITPPAIPRVTSDISLFAPSRRRSMALTPGVATRSQTMMQASRANVRAMLGVPGLRRRNTDSEGALGRLTADWMVGVQGKREEERERVVTPVEERYMQLGGMKFGSLRIMNGTPEGSPRSSLMLEKVEGSRPGSAELEEKPEEEEREEEKKEHENNEQEKEELKETEDELKEVETEETTEPEPRKSKKPATLPTLNLESSGTPEGSPSPIHPPFGTPIASLFTDTSKPSLSIGQPSPLSTAFSDTKASFISDIDIDFGNFSLSRENSLKLQITSKPQATDCLFDNDSDSEFSPEVLDVREDSNANPTIDTGDSSTAAAAALSTGRCPSVKTISRSTSTALSTPSEDSAAGRLMKTDSGYGSNASLRSFRSSRLVRRDSKARAAGSQSQSLVVRALGPSSLERTLSSASSLRSPSPRTSPTDIPDVPPLPSPFQEGRQSRGAEVKSPKSPRSRFATGLSKNPSVGSHARTSSATSSSYLHIAFLSISDVDGHVVKRRSSYEPKSPAFLHAPQSPGHPSTAGSLSSSLGSVSGCHGDAKISKFWRLLSSAGLRSHSREGLPTLTVDSGSRASSSGLSRRAKDLKSSELLHPSVQRLVRSQPSKATLQTIMSVGSYENQSPTQENRSRERLGIPVEPVVQEEDEKSAAESKLRRKRSFMGDGFAGALARSKSFKKVIGRREKKDEPAPAPTAEAHPERPSRYQRRLSKGADQAPKEKKKSTEEEAHQQKEAFEQALKSLSEERKKTINPMLGRVTSGRSRKGRDRSATLGDEDHDEAINFAASLQPEQLISAVHQTDMKHSTSTPAMRSRSLVGMRFSTFWGQEAGRREELERRGSQVSSVSSNEGLMMATLPCKSMSPAVPIPAVPAEYRAQSFTSSRPPSRDLPRPSSAASTSAVNSGIYHSLSMHSLSTYQRQSPSPGTSTHGHFVQQNALLLQQQRALARLHPQLLRPMGLAGSMMMPEAGVVTPAPVPIGPGSGMPGAQVPTKPPSCAPRARHGRQMSWSVEGRVEACGPYRVLHSYNSPAYRGAPIWG